MSTFVGLLNALWPLMVGVVVVMSVFFPGDIPVEEWTHVLVMWVLIGMVLDRRSVE